MGTHGSVHRPQRAMGARGWARTSRRMFGTRGSGSVVARDAVEWGTSAVCRVLPAVALHEPAHRQGARRRAEARQASQTVAALLIRTLPHASHLLPPPVTSP